MKKAFFTVALLALSLSYNQAMARDTKHLFPLSSAMNTEAAAEKLTGEIKFYFGDDKPAHIERRLGSFTANRKTNAFNKSDKNACEWVFLSAMLALQSKAIEVGGDAVIIHSNYKNNIVKSNTEYECGAGALMAGVTLVGEVVKLKK